MGLFAGLSNFIPYVGQMLGGGLPALVTLAQYESPGDALIVAAVYLGLVTIEGYIVTPYVLGRSLDPERYGDPGGLPVLGISLGVGGADSGDADYRLLQTGLPERAEPTPLGEPDEPRLAAARQ